MQGILSICFVNAFMAYNHFEGQTEKFKSFQNEVCMEMIQRHKDSKHSSNSSPLGKRTSDQASPPLANRTVSSKQSPAAQSVPRSPSSRTVHNIASFYLETEKRKNGRCKVCPKDNANHAYFYCKDCSTSEDTFWVCGPGTGRTCFQDHAHKAK